ncbi:hypothetical protein Tco_0054336 [Tanacetum coccineum]
MSILSLRQVSCAQLPCLECNYGVLGDLAKDTFLSLNEDILKITILKTNTPYLSRKIRRIRSYTHQRPQRNKAQYAVSRETQYTVFKIWNEHNILEDIKRGFHIKDNSTNTPISNLLGYAVS